MNIDTTPLFTPLTIKSKQLPNRIVMPPMRTLRDVATEDGRVWYGARAKGGAGLVILECTSVTRFPSDLTAEKLKPLADVIHDGGALAAIQLIPVAIERQLTPPAELDRREIDTILANYRAAAEVCREAGFDGIEVHGAHGFVLNQFFSPVQNTRTDGYGGGIENRMRLALEIVQALHPVCADEVLMLYRHTPVGKGYGIEESLVLAEALVSVGVDILDLSPSSVESPGDHTAPFSTFSVPTIAVGELNDVARALDVLNHHRAHLVAVGRGLIADAEWPNKVREGRFDDITECVGCNKGCYGNLAQSIPVRCVRQRS